MIAAAKASFAFMPLEREAIVSSAFGARSSILRSSWVRGARRSRGKLRIRPTYPRNSLGVRYSGRVGASGM